MFVVCIYVCAFACKCVNMYICVHVYAFLCVLVYVTSGHVCMCVFIASVCKSVYVFMIRVYVCI